MAGDLRHGNPQRIGPYRVVKRLGEGGMGVVYLGAGPDGRPVAIKVIRADHVADPGFRARFKREVAAAQRVRRFCTAQFLDAQPDADPPFLVTEFVDGPSLHDRVATGNRLQNADLEALAVGVAAALTAIHDAGVVHRDLKPANVLLSPFGPRVIDFGVARLADLTRISVAGSLIGTPAYMAPEQIRGEPVTAAADVFAWGAVITFAACGQPPFQGESAAAVMHRILTAEPNLDALGGALRDQVRAALSKFADRRPTAHDVLQNLIASGAPARVLDTAPMNLPAAGEATSAQGPPVWGPTGSLPPWHRSNGAEDAEAWYRRAADAGDVEAMIDLGDVLVLRAGGWDEEAEHWYRQAADAGHIVGAARLGHLYQWCDQSWKAEPYLRQAADAGYPAAMIDLGNLLMSRGEDAEAESWFRSAADAGDANGLVALATKYEWRGDGYNKYYYQLATAQFRRATSTGGLEAMIDLGDILLLRVGSNWRGLRGGWCEEAEEAKHWYQQAADAGHIVGIARLGRLYQRCDQSWKAEPHLRQAADAGYPAAMIDLGHLLADRGEEAEAKRWRQRAADAGGSRVEYWYRRLRLGTS